MSNPFTQMVLVIGWIFAILGLLIFLNDFLFPYLKRRKHYTNARKLMKKAIKNAKEKGETEESIRKLKEIDQGIKDLMNSDKL